MKVNRVCRTEDERAIMMEHVRYWTKLINEGKVVVFGPVLDPGEVYELGVISVDNEEEVKEFIANDPAAKINRYEYFPMIAIVPTK
jgi:uncharacterized protein